MDQRINRFTLTDKVVWDKDIYPTLVGGMIQKYGEGPFEVVALRLHRHKAHFPVAVTVELRDGESQEFAGQWFKKI